MSAPPLRSANNDVPSIYYPTKKSPDGYYQTPKWMSSFLNNPAKEIARMHVSESAKLYDMLLSYFVAHASNVDTDKLNQGSKDKTGDQLTSLACRGFELIQDRSDEDSERTSGGFQNKKEDKSQFKAKYGLGLGVFRITVNEETVIIIHSGTGPPLPGRTGNPTVYFDIQCFAREQATLMSMIDEALNWLSKQIPVIEGEFGLYTLDVECGEANWDLVGLRKGRALDSIILPKGLLNSILDDFRDFAASDTKKWYIKHGLPHRRSYLFYGPPGVGKTSTIRALAGVFRRSACFLSMGNKDIGNKQIQDAMKYIPRPSILVIEDVDSLFNEERKTENDSQLTFSGLLNVLDGLMAADNIVTILTTNHIDRLDPALIRAGRVDRKFAFDRPAYEQIKMLFLSYYPEADESLACKFADDVHARTEKEACTIATLQEHFIFTRKKTAKESASMVDLFFSRFRPGTNKKED